MFQLASGAGCLTCQGHCPPRRGARPDRAGPRVWRRGNREPRRLPTFGIDTWTAPSAAAVKLASLQSCRRIPLLLRVRRFYETLGRCFLFGVGDWRIKENLLRKIQSWEHGLLRQMRCRHKLPEEHWQQYYNRIDTMIKSVLNRLKIMPWSLQACTLYFGWAGHVSRLDPKSAIRVVMNWRDLSWFRLAKI